MVRIALALLFTVSFATTALADFGPRFWGPSTKLIYIGPTYLSTPTGTRSLCIQVHDQHAFFVPYDRQVAGYALSTSDCLTPEVDMLTPLVVTRLIGASLLPPGVPETPAAPLNISLRSQAVALLFAILFCATPWILRRRLSPASRRMRQLSGDPLYYDVLLSVLFHVARTDGVIEKAEVEAIRAVYESNTGTKVTAEMTSTHFARYPSEASILNLVQGYRGPEAELMLDAAIQVAAFAGVITREKKAFLMALNERLERTPHWLDQAVRSALRPRTERTGEAHPG